MKKIRFYISMALVFLMSVCLVACKGKEPDKEKATNIYFAYNNMELVVGEEITVPIIYEPFGSVCEDLQWYCANESVVILDNGVVSAIGVGETKITAWTDDGIYDEMFISVVEGSIEYEGEVEVKLSVDGAIYTSVYTSCEKDYILTNLPSFDDYAVDDTKPVYFEGWYLDEDFTIRVQSDTQVKKDCTIYANFVKVDVTDFEYVVVDGKAVITKCYEFYNKTIVVPNKIGGYEVNEISSGAFSVEHDYLRKPNYAVRNLILLDGVQTLPILTFCDKIESIVIPATVNSFSGTHLGTCQTLKNISVDENNQTFKSISGNLYSKDGKILYKYCIQKEDTSFIIPESVETIGEYAIYFSDPSDEEVINLESIVIGSNIKKMDKVAINLDYLLIDIHIEDLENWCKIDFSSGASPLYFAKNIYIDGQKVDDLIIPDGVEEIKERTFYGVRVNSVTLSNTVTKIGSMAFCNSELSKVTFSPSLVEIDESAFYESYNLETLVFPTISNLKRIGEFAFKKCSVANIILPEGLETIENYAFDNCNARGGGDTTIYIPASVTSVGKSAFILPNLYYQSNSKIFCGATSKPSGWASDWYYHGDLDRIYWYSTEKPSVNGNYWCYLDGSYYIWGEGMEA